MMLAAAVYDLRERRIPNCLVVAAIILAFGMHGMAGGLDRLAFIWLLGLMAGAGLLILPFLMGGMGAGDVKLLACAGSMLGPVQVFYAFLAAAVLGGLMAVGKAAAQGKRKKEKGKNCVAEPDIEGMQRGVLQSAGADCCSPSCPPSASPARIPYGLPLAAGVLLSAAGAWL